MSLQDTIDVAVTAHPSLLQIPDDIEALNKKSTPFLFNTASEDVMVRSLCPCRRHNLFCSYSLSRAV